MTKEKTIYIIHGWASSPSDCWFPWLKNYLEEKGYTVHVPEMPNPRYPDVSRWIHTLKELTKNIDLSKAYFIGHSLGCYTILRFLEELPKEMHVGGVLCVGGSMGLRGKPRISGEKVVPHTRGNIQAIFSDNDYYIPLSEKEEFEKHLGAQTLVLEGRGHFSRKEHITEIPEILPLLEQLIT